MKPNWILPKWGPSCSRADNGPEEQPPLPSVRGFCPAGKAQQKEERKEMNKEASKQQFVTGYFGVGTVWSAKYRSLAQVLALWRGRLMAATLATVTS